MFLGAGIARSMDILALNSAFEAGRPFISEPRIAKKCPGCGEVFLIPLIERALFESYFRCSKCGFTEQHEPEFDPDKPDQNE
jgi:predicted RNA-binding Zn-ribbon protein involved in translation (DUF1610 family)